MLSSAAEDRNDNDPDEYVPPNEYDIDPYEIEQMNNEYQRKEIDTNIEFENVVKIKSKHQQQQLSSRIRSRRNDNFHFVAPSGNSPTKTKMPLNAKSPTSKTKANMFKNQNNLHNMHYQYGMDPSSSSDDDVDRFA